MMACKGCGATTEVAHRNRFNAKDSSRCKAGEAFEPTVTVPTWCKCNPAGWYQEGGVKIDDRCDHYEEGLVHNRCKHCSHEKECHKA